MILIGGTLSLSAFLKIIDISFNYQIGAIMDKQSIMTLIDDLNVGKGFLIAVGDLYYQTENTELVSSFLKSKIDEVYTNYFRDVFVDLSNQEFKDHAFYVAIDNLLKLKTKNIENIREILAIVSAIDEMIEDYKQALDI